MITRKITPDGAVLAKKPAASMKRAQTKGAPFSTINSSLRTIAEQEALFFSRYTVQWFGSGPYGDVRWYKGVRYVRTSGAGMVAIPGTSKHTSGTALDISLKSPLQKWMLEKGGAFGWRSTIPSEPWHWEYRQADDKRKWVVGNTQVALHRKKDYDFGPGSDRALTLVRMASSMHGNKFPDGIVATQKVIGAKPTGKWDAQSRAAHDATVKELKRIWKNFGYKPGTVDTTWDKEMEEARKRFRQDNR